MIAQSPALDPTEFNQIICCSAFFIFFPCVGREKAIKEGGRSRYYINIISRDLWKSIRMLIESCILCGDACQ
jgi:hypothetical protein